MSIIDIVVLLVEVLVMVGVICTGFAYLTLFERRMLARFQHRVGPNRAGPWGLLQPAADAIKLFFKEDVIPTQADRWVYLIAPALAVMPAMVIWAVIPLGCFNIAGSYQACFDPALRGELQNVLQIADVNVGVLYLLAITSIGVYGVTLAGWASNSKYAMLGGIRSSAQLISYELALGMAVMGSVMIANTLSTSEMVNNQIYIWIVFPQLLGFVLFMVSANAELVRAPFDLVEAEQELTSGYNTEYGSMKFALFFMAEYIKMIALSAMAVTFFLGGWHPIPGIPILEWVGAAVESVAGVFMGALVVGLVSLLAFTAKTVVLLYWLVWLRATLPRVRYDRLMELGWKVLLPLALLNLIVTPVVVVLFPNALVHSLILFVFSVAVLVGVGYVAKSWIPRPTTSGIKLVQPVAAGRRTETGS